MWLPVKKDAYGPWGKESFGPIERLQVGDIDHRKGHTRVTITRNRQHPTPTLHRSMVSYPESREGDSHAAWPGRKEADCCSSRSYRKGTTAPRPKWTTERKGGTTPKHVFGTRISRSVKSRDARDDSAAQISIRLQRRLAWVSVRASREGGVYIVID